MLSVHQRLIADVTPERLAQRVRVSTHTTQSPPVASVPLKSQLKSLQQLLQKVAIPTIPLPVQNLPVQTAPAPKATPVVTSAALTQPATVTTQTKTVNHQASKQPPRPAVTRQAKPQTLQSQPKTQPVQLTQAAIQAQGAARNLVINVNYALAIASQDLQRLALQQALKQANTAATAGGREIIII